MFLNKNIFRNAEEVLNVVQELLLLFWSYDHKVRGINAGLLNLENGEL